MTRLSLRAIVLATAGLSAIVIVIAGALRWDEMALWFQGWRIAWMPPGVLPSEGRQVLLNSSGQVLVELSAEERRPRAGRWSLATGEFVDLGTLPVDGDPYTLGLAINDLGHIVSADDGLARAFLWTDESGMRELPGLGGAQTAPTYIDGKDRVTGWALPGPRRGLPRRPFLWTREAGTQDLGTLSAKDGDDCAYVILGDGRVLGASSGHIFLWSPESGQRDLGRPTGSLDACPVSANNRGEVLCSVVTNLVYSGPEDTSNLCAPFLWTEAGGFAALPVPPGFDDVDSLGIADDGAVLLHAMKLPDRVPIGYLLKNGKFEILPVPLGWSSAQYMSMNSRGWLLGIAERNRGGNVERRGFILKPTR
jgi:hypothetical protein